MKRILSAFLLLTILMSVCIIGAPSVAAAEVASVVADGKAAVNVNVGDVFVYTFYVKTGTPYKVASMQASTTFDDSRLQLLVDYMPDPDFPEYAVSELIMFPNIVNAGLVFNNSRDDSIEFNYAQAQNGVRMNKDNFVLITAKFKVIAAGTSTIDTNIKYMEQNLDGKGNLVKVISESKLMDSVNYPITLRSEIKTGQTYIIGDVDCSGELDVMDATYMQLKLAKYPVSVYNEYAQDSDSNGDFDVMDATYVQLYLAKLPVPKNVMVGREDVKTN